MPDLPARALDNERLAQQIRFLVETDKLKAVFAVPLGV